MRIYTHEDIGKAKELAEEYHKDQLYGEHPYITHIETTVNSLAMELILTRYINDTDKICFVVAYLHDILEDTCISKDTILEIFGEDVLRAIELVTDEPGHNRKTRKTLTNSKLSKLSVDNRVEKAALMVKAADRNANLRTSCKAFMEGSNKGLLSMYYKEHEEFKKAVYRKGLLEGLWSQMDISFRPLKQGNE